MIYKIVLKMDWNIWKNEKEEAQYFPITKWIHSLFKTKHAKKKILGSSAAHQWVKVKEKQYLNEWLAC
jgi:hypothetical protein